MSRRSRRTRRGTRREPVDPHAPIKGQLALFGGEPDHENTAQGVPDQTMPSEDDEQ